MFSFFKRDKNKKTPIQEHLSDFQNDLSKNQKVAIIASLFIIAKSDGIHLNEGGYIAKITEVLDLNEDDPAFVELAQKGHHEIIKHLDSLSDLQKDWYILAVHGLISSDGEITEREVNFAMGFCKDIGITEEEYIIMIKKTEGLYK
ncbi:hypothetical protein [Fodinibius salsisoli]|uniref:Tellurite resistance protein TerB n=1 Tax=Fodinibius salsisoli TaxID=2820877 RepID=A0ABT3PKR3_9BACT|nr:hypothetical protein [Fodinibius salsisoli]MCW9705804.1 hypothetical protein [Fodinibius salsisoli]